MRIEQLLYITEIAKTGSIANTSERLFVSSPGISLAISKLEEELGVKIFERSRNGLEPTESGSKLIVRAQDILNRIEEFKQEAKSGTSEVKGLLSISATPGICRSLIPLTSAELNTKFPKVTLQIKETSPAQIQRDVLNGDADIGLIFSFSSTIEENQLLTTTHLTDSSMRICFRNDSELASKNTLTTEDIYKYPIAASMNINDTKKFILQIFGEYNQFVNFLVSQNPETKKHFISQGLAIGFEPYLTTQTDSFYQREDIIVLPLSDIKPLISYHSIKLKNRYFPIAGKEFLKALQNQANHFKE
ncbi:LysR family transcriptional regulator [Bacillus sp. JJ722]|uniref:LysR family transcriptional regulator n=1 Tax=Bacillus sp. JJ722 TaxID=3122973 RepID=UPI002FFDB6DB